MSAGQRRMLWFCTFAMCFIFFFEASGRPLIHPSNAPEFLDDGAAWAHFLEQAGIGGFFLALGATVSVVLQRTRKFKAAEPETVDWVALAISTGVLAATLFRSYQAVMG